MLMWLFAGLCIIFCIRAGYLLGKIPPSFAEIKRIDKWLWAAIICIVIIMVIGCFK